MANEEPKKFSDELKALRAEFNDLAEKAKKTVAKLDSAIFKQEILELRQANDAVVNTFAVPGFLESVNNRDVVVLVNKSKDMGAGFDSAIGKALTAASEISRVVKHNYDMTVTAQTYGAGNSRGVNISDYDRMEKETAKTEQNQKDIVPALRDFMVSNTPDKVKGRNNHYIIVSDGNFTDTVQHASQMIEATLLYNKKATFDFVTIGAGGPTLAELSLKLSHSLIVDRVGFHQVEKPEQLQDAITNVLKTRIAASPYVKPAPQPEAAPQPANTASAPKQAPTP